MQTHKTDNEGGALKEQRPQQIQPRDQALPQAQAPTAQMTSQSYFPDKLQLLYNSRYDKRLTPATQLVYRVLMDMLNLNHWLQPVVLSNAELKQLTHITSDQDITRVKQRLQSMGYIEFHGKPSNYIIYSPPAHKQAQAQAQNGDKFNYPTRQLQLPKEEINKEERVTTHDNDNSDADWRNSKEVAALLKGR